MIRQPEFGGTPGFSPIPHNKPVDSRKNPPAGPLYYTPGPPITARLSSPLTTDLNSPHEPETTDMSTKTSPQEHEVMAEIHRVVESNPEFGIKRVANVLKEQNPEWTLGDKRGI